MKYTTFGKFIKKHVQDFAIEAGVCVVQRKSKSQVVEVECLLINVTGLTPSAIEELAQASLNAVNAAKGGK